jgi:uncharacterized membrane protein
VIGLAAIEFSNLNWQRPVVLFLLALAAVSVWSGRRSAVSLRVRIGCALLKLTGILVLALCLLEPFQIGQRAKPGANFFALIADNSQSLQIKDNGETRSRGEILREVLAGKSSDWQSSLDENFQVRRYTFDSRLQNSRAFGDLDFQGHASALGNALRSVAERWRGQPVAGVLLFTDGNATDLAGEMPSLAGLPPVYPVVLGQEAGLRDISVEKVAVSQTAFEDAPVTVQAEVAARGFAGADIVAQLKEIDSVAAIPRTNQTAKAQPTAAVAGPVKSMMQLSQHAPGSDARLVFRFQVQPSGPGLHFYELDASAREELDAPSQPSREATLINNRRMFVVDRGQEPFRVLYVSGRPNWEYKFLNRAIADDPQVQLVGLIRVAKREPKFNFMGRAGESSNPLFRGFDSKDEETARYDQPVLVRLNTRDEFELRGGFPKTAEELFPYHAVIVGDAEAEFFTHDQMTLLQQFVSERGGGFMMLGGAESLREGNYAGTPIASVLPAYLDRTVEAKLPNQFHLALTREGWLQPWMRLRATEADEKTRLESLPAFQVVNPLHDVKPGASVLATVTDSEGRTFPAVAVQRFGHGRTAVVAVGDLWRWGLQSESMQKDLEKAWRQMVRWLVADVPPRIFTSVEPAPNGDPTQFRLTVSAHDEEFKPLDGAAVSLTVRQVRSLSADAASSANEQAVATNSLHITADPSSVEAGKYEATYVTREAGAYVAQADVRQADGKMAGSAVAGWVSDPAVDEFRSLKPNRALLETIAKRTGGQVVALEDLQKFVRTLPQRSAPITESWSLPLWHQPSVFLFVLVCFLAEWGIRRWKGLP